MPTAGHTWSVTTELVEIDDTSTGMIETGMLGHVDITTSMLSKCGTALCFAGGSLDITSTSGATLFDEVFTSGTVLKFGNSTFFNAVLADGGTTMIASNTGSFSSDSVISTRAGVVAEPASLSLLGSGLITLGFLRAKSHSSGKRHP